MLTPTGQVIKTNSPCTIVFGSVGPDGEDPSAKSSPIPPRWLLGTVPGPLQRIGWLTNPHDQYPVENEDSGDKLRKELYDAFVTPLTLVSARNWGLRRGAVVSFGIARMGAPCRGAAKSRNVRFVFLIVALSAGHPKGRSDGYKQSPQGRSPRALSESAGCQALCT